jgi:hypothetical protein
VPPTVCGTSSCHNQTFRAASVLVWGFCLSVDEAMGLLSWWADMGTHKWSQHDLRHKCESALDARHTQPRGHLVNEDDARGELPSYTPPAAVEPEKSEEYDKSALMAVTRKDWNVNAAWLRERSPVDPRGVTSEAFLDAIYEPGDKVMVFTDLRGQGNYMQWVGKGSFLLGKSQDVKAQKVKQLPPGAQQGMWFLIQPHDGKWYPKSRSNVLSRRGARSIAAYRFMLLESDKAPMWPWLNAVCQLRLPIVAIVTSANQGAHVLVKVEADNQQEWEQMRDLLKPTLTKIGMDGDAMKAIVYCRLPGAFREGKIKGEVDAAGKPVMNAAGKRSMKFVPFPDGRRVQQLLYFNPRPLPLIEFSDEGKGNCIGEGVTFSHE